MPVAPVVPKKGYEETYIKEKHIPIKPKYEKKGYEETTIVKEKHIPIKPKYEKNYEETYIKEKHHVPIVPIIKPKYEKNYEETYIKEKHHVPIVPIIKPKYEKKYEERTYVEKSHGYDGSYVNKHKTVTTLSTVACNKMIDGLLGKLQHSFTSHMSSYKMESFEPVPIGSWARVRLYDGHFEKIGKMCRGGDFQVLPQGDNIVIRGTISVPEPAAKFNGDAYLYNRLKVRNSDLHLCAKDASFRMQMIVNKRLKKIDIDELEPVAISGFHVEDEKGHMYKELPWPFSKIRETQLVKQKYQFMSQLQHKLCDNIREMVSKREVKEEILQLV